MSGWTRWQYGLVTLYLRNGRVMTYTGKVRTRLDSDVVTEYQTSGDACLMVPPLRDIFGITCEPVFPEPPETDPAETRQEPVSDARPT